MRDRAAQPTGSIAFETVLQQSNPGQTGDTVREAVRDEAAWTALWAKLREGTALPEEPPVVDFRTDMVIAAAMETPGCVAKVTIRKIVQESGGLAVDLLEAPPAPNCVCITSERPLHIVRLPRAEGPVRFDVERGQTSC
ncbi:MAG TPA: hypothetical protein VLQ45_01185 [Thermoanaerobaculia bacterium]|nr:hypothetical protein [Thermoanaerobaculia bacterium]